MTAQPVSKPASPMLEIGSQTEPETQFYLRVLTYWHLIVAVAAAAGMIYAWVPASGLTGWLRLLITLTGMSVVLGSGLAALHILRLKHTGRMLSFILNYVIFGVCLAGLLHLTGAFLTLDDLADTFPQGIPYLAVVIAGYLLHVITEYMGASGGLLRQTVRIMSRILMAIGSGLFLLISIIVPMVSYLIREWASPFTTVTGIVLMLAAVAFGLAGRDTEVRRAHGMMVLSGAGAVLLSITLLLEFKSILPAGMLLIGLLSLALMWMVWRHPTAHALRATIGETEVLEGFMFLSPNLLGFLLFFVGPLLFSLYVSFTDWDAFGTKEWIGLQNYAEIFNITAAPAAANQPFSEALDATTYAELARLKLFGQQYVIGAQDKLFWISLWNTLLFGVLSVPLSVIPALLLAVILNSKLKGMTFFRAVYFLPSVAAVVGVALIWRWLYNSTVGWINYFITGIISFLNTVPGVAIADPAIGWLSDGRVALLAVVIMTSWQWIGFNTVLFLAGLQGVPGDLYEAATVDGAGAWARFWKITLPMLAPTTFFVVSTRIIAAMQLFDQVFVMTNPPGGPGSSTMTLTLHLYRNGFQNFRQGYASAIAWVLFLLIFGITLVQFQRQRSTMAYEG